jgi:hypothetical protein
LAFVVTTDDRAVPKEAQFGMMAATKQAWVVKELASSHCGPFLNCIDETVALTKEIIEEFLRLELCPSILHGGHAQELEA